MMVPDDAELVPRLDFDAPITYGTARRLQSAAVFASQSERQVPNTSQHGEEVPFALQPGPNSAPNAGESAESEIQTAYRDAKSGIVKNISLIIATSSGGGKFLFAIHSDGDGLIFGINVDKFLSKDQTSMIMGQAKQQGLYVAKSSPFQFIGGDPSGELKAAGGNISSTEEYLFLGGRDLKAQMLYGAQTEQSQRVSPIVILLSPDRRLIALSDVAIIVPYFSR